MSYSTNSIIPFYSANASTANANGQVNKNTSTPIFNYGYSSSNNNNKSGSSDLAGMGNIPDLDTYLKSQGLTVNSNGDVDYTGMGWTPSSSSRNYTPMGWPPTFDKVNPVSFSNTSSSKTNNTTTTPGKGMSSANAGTYGGTSLTQDQVKNAKIIADVGKSMGMSQHDIQTAIATAMQESSLENVDYGDDAGPDSCGLFQQRDSWGSRKDRMDPATAAKLFYNALKAVPNREQKSLAESAYSVQHCAKEYKDRYGNWENMAKSLTA